MKDLRDPHIPYYDLRAQLRARLRLLEPEAPAIASGAQVMLDDTEMLALLEHLQISFAAAEAASRTRYVDALDGTVGVPDFDALRQDGWFEILFGRVVTPIEISVAGKRATAISPGLPDLLSGRFAETFDFSAVPTGTKAIDDTVAGLSSGALRFVDLDCRTPDWVAARLWERRPSDHDPLRWWLDRWNLLQQPFFTPWKVWDSAEADVFTNLVLDRLESEPALIGWNGIRQAIADQEMRAAGRGDPAKPDRIPEIPDSLVARARWLGDPWVAAIPQMRLQAFEEARRLVDLLTSDVEQRRHLSLPHPQYSRLVEIALARPDLLQALQQRALRHPVLIAEFLVVPETCSFGCALLATHAPGEALPIDDPDSGDVALAALEDGLALLERYLKADPARLGEDAAALLSAAFDTAGRPRRQGLGKATGAQVIRALRQLGGDAAPLAESLAAAGAPESLDAPAFVAALSLIAAADLVERVSPDPLPDGYIQAIRTGHSQLSADRMTPERAAALFRLANRCGAGRLSQFLHPVDWRAALAGVDKHDFETLWLVARGIEAGTRTLSNAVRGLGAAAPGALIAALADHVVAGSEDDFPAGRTWAFSARLQSLPWSRPPEATVGALLGTALSALDSAAREPLLLACLELKEPTLLADLYQTAPLEDRTRIAARIEDLGVADALEAHSFTAITARIDALLDAGLTEPAEEQIQAGLQATTIGKITERPRIEFNQALRLLYLKGDWPGIMAAVVPAPLPQFEREACERILANYQAIALLQDPDADPRIAVARLEPLVKANPTELGYQVNLFAAKMTALLGSARFPILPASEQTAARGLIAEVERWMAETLEATDKDRQICTANLAVLDLAIGDPGHALERLRTLPVRDQSAPRTAYLAIAYGRTGRTAEAQEVLDTGAVQFSGNVLIAAARAHLFGETDPGGAATSQVIAVAQSVEQSDRLAVMMTIFLSSTPPQRAAILRGASDNLGLLIAEHLDNALCSVANLAPRINKGVVRDDEDDITALVKISLNASLPQLGLSSADQSKGGYTPVGNYGERDLILINGSTEYAVIEAVIADKSVRKSILTEHFRKMLGYGDCPLYFHLTYAWMDDTAGLIKTLENIARDEAPDGHDFKELQLLPRSGNGPSGFKARYRTSAQQIDVIFRVLDLGQHRLRHAATSSVAKLKSPSRASPAKNAGKGKKAGK